MKTYIGLLRGINVGGQKKIKMVDLKLMFENLGFGSVRTYIQSGNIIFKSDKTELGIIRDCINKGIMDTFGYDVPVLIFTLEVLKSIYNKNPFLNRISKGEIEEKKMYFTLLSSPPDSQSIQTLETQPLGKEEFIITQNVVYFFAANGYGNTKLNNNFFEKKLKVGATTRNLRTLSKLLELSI